MSRLSQEGIELFQGSDRILIQGIEPDFFEYPERTFCFNLAGAAPNFRVQKHSPDGVVKWILRMTFG